MPVETDVAIEGLEQLCAAIAARGRRSSWSRGIIVVAMAERIAYSTKEERPVAAADVRRLYDGAGWWPGWALEGIERAIAASIAVGAWDGERLIGFARAISDGEHRAYIEDVVIDPEYRGRKIGEGLVAALVEELAGVHIVSLFAEPGRVAFYERNGFLASETAVMLHREAPGKGGAPYWRE